jgi:hypothetical protein
MSSLGSDELEGRSWIAFSDVALSILFVFLVFIFAQFVYYQKIAITEELERRRGEMIGLIADSIPEQFATSIAIDSGTEYSQRIRFSSDLLFEPCRDIVTERGDSLVVLVGQLLARRVSYFKAIEVEGHTDWRQPRGPPSCPFRDNWELSSRRAATVVRSLREQAGVFPGILAAVGKGEHHPVTSIAFDTTTLQLSDLDAQLRDDRRIELLLQYSEENIRDSLEKR